MKSIIAAVVTCAILFGVSYYAADYYSKLKPEPTEDEVAPEETVDPEKSTLPPNPDEIKQKKVTMQVSERPEKAVSLEAVLQMSDSIKRMEEKLILRERKILKDEQRIKMMFADMETEQDELTAFAESIEMKVDVLGKKTEELRGLLAQLEAKKTEIANLEKKAGVDDDSKRVERDTRVKQVLSWFSSLDARQASDYLKEFANTGKMDFAAELLQKLPERQKAKILAEMKDPVLVNQLIDALDVRPKGN